ncbi:MAG TPA: hypothetical protein P5167_05265 [Bacteroidales bacterium]|nr:hypothetical protein [Bacteroidales bacterium]
MKNAPRTYWFSLKPYVYPVVKDANVLLLNTMDMNAIISNSNPVIARLMRELLVPSAFGVVEISEESEYFNKEKAFIDKVCDHQMGTMTRTEKGMERPVVLTPYHFRMHSVTKGEIRKSGNNITLFIDNECSRDCTLCPVYFRQFKCCHKQGNTTFMDTRLIRDILEDVSQYDSFIINVCGGDISLHPDIEDIVTMLNDSPVKTRYHIYYKNWDSETKKMLDPKDTVVIVDFPLDRKMHIDPREGYSFNFVIKNREELEACHQLVLELSVESFYISVVDTGDHTGFLKENVFLLQDGLACGAASIPYKERIRIVNNHYFYRTFVLPDGDVCGSSDNISVANLYRNPMNFVKDSINNYHASLWDKSRDNGICSHCIFHYICPLLSRYDLSEPFFELKIENHGT